MTSQERFRVILPGGLTSLDTFVVASPQPSRIRAGCLLMTHEYSGRQITVHATRLAPVEVAGQPSERVCPNCGKVQGVVEDEVACPYEGGALAPADALPRIYASRFASGDHVTGTKLD